MRWIRAAAVRFSTVLGFFVVAALLAGTAQAALTVTPLTWDVVGLDSNSPTTGPRYFPVGARVCTDTAIPAGGTANFVWDSANANVNLRTGSLSSITLPALAVGACTDAYFEVEVNPVAGAYDTTRRYHIQATSGVFTASTPTPRQIYVEHLVSQNRNYITNVRYGPNVANLSAVAAGGALSLIVGNTYVIELSGGTATQGYEQFEAFINFTNTIFQVLSVSTTYSADTTPYVSSPNDKLYGDACFWESDPNSPNYRSCKSSGKIGGSSVVTLYTVKIIGGGGTSQPLSTLLYDFSGSSFHYNADYSVGARVASIVDPTTADITKSFSPNPATLGGVSVLTLKLTNPNGAPLSGYNFVDNLPANMTVASPANATTSGCGTPTLTANPGATSLSFSNGTVVASGTCTISVDVTTSTTGTFSNTTNDLFIGSLDTGKTASATLTVNSAPPAGSGLCGLPLATWKFESGFNTSSPAPTSALVATSAAPGAGVGAISETTLTADGTAAWGSNGAIAVGTPLATANNDYFQFSIDTTGYDKVYLTFNSQFRSANGPKGVAVYWGTSVSPPGTQIYANDTALATSNTTVAFGSGNSIGVTSGLNPSGPTYFRIYFYNSGNTNPGSDPVLDDVVFTGCAAGIKPTISKSFAPDPIVVGGTSTLTFTLTNANSVALTGATFTDTLPSGMQVAATPAASTTCTGSPTWAPAAGSTNLTFGTPTGGTIPASGSCTAKVNVTMTAAGTLSNVSGFLSTTETGTTTSSVATDTLTAVRPPSIAKRFAPNPILPGGTSRLTFTITNPNPDNAIAGVAFSDTLPNSPGAMLVAATPNATTAGCGAPTFAPAAGAASLSFSNGSIAAGGTCTVSVDVTAPTTGSYANTSGTVSHIVNGSPSNGNTASDTLVVNPTHPGVSLLKQVGPTASGPWSAFRAIDLPGQVYWRIVVENTGDVPLNPLAITDPTLSLASCSWPASLPVAGPANDNHIATCIVGPIGGTSGVTVNTANVNATGSSTQVTDVSTASYASTGLSITKTPSSLTYTAAGQSITYTFVVTNTGNATLDGPISVIDDVIGTVTCPSLTTIGDNDAFFDPNEQLTCTANYTTTAQDVTNTRITNHAYATNGSTDSPTVSVTVYLTGTDLTDLAIVKTGPASVTGGSLVSYSVTVTNNGEYPADGATFSDNVPAAITGVSASCSGSTNGAGCPAPVVAGNLVTAVISPLPVGGTLTFTVTGIAPGNAMLLSNTATIAVPTGMTDTNAANDSSTAMTSVLAQADLAITKTDGSATYTPGAGITYTIVASNAGPGDVVGATVTDALPVALLGATWTCTASGSGAACPASGSGSINALVDLPAGTTATFTLSATVDANASGNLVNTATVTPPAGVTDPTSADDSATDTDTLAAQSALAVTKTDGSATYTPGGTATYTITVTNAGPSTASSVSLSDPLPAGVALAGTPTCVANSIGSVCGTITGAANDPAFSISGASVDAIAGASLVYTVPVKFASDMTAGSIVNTVTASSPSSPNAIASDTDTRLVQTGLTVIKTDGNGSYTPGGTAIYAITVGNTGPSDAASVTVTDNLPAGVTLTATPTCTPSGAAVCGTLTGTAGSTSFGVSGASIPVGQTLTFSLPVALAANLATNPLVNVASADAPGNGGPVSDQDSDVPAAATGLTVTKDDGSTTYTPGGAATYTVTVSNAGPSDASAVTLADSLPAGVTLTATPTCVVNGTGACGTISGNAGGASFGVNGAQIAAGTSLAYTLPVQFAASLTADPLVNTVSVSDPSDPSSPHTASDSDARSAVTSLGVTKSDGSLVYTPGGTATYTITVTNAGPSDAHNVGLSDNLPAGVTLSGTPTCSPGGTATCGSVSGTVGGSTVTASAGSIAAGAGNALVFSVPVAYGAGLVTDPLVNTASASDPDDPNGASGSDSDVLQGSTGLTVTKDDGSPTYVPGGNATYTIVVTNAGPSNANNIAASDTLPPGVALAGAPTCTVAGSGTCGTVSGALGGSSFTVNGAALAPGAGNSLTFQLPVAFASSLTADPLANTVQVHDPSDPVTHFATDSDTRSANVSLAVAKSDGSATYTPGGTATYTITVINTGLSDAGNVSLTDTLPAGVTFSGAPTCVPNGGGSASCGTLNVAGSTLTLSGAVIPSGAGYSLVLSVPVQFAANLQVSPLDNTVTVSDPDGPGASDTDSDVRAAVADLALVKSGPPSVGGGGPITYTLVITNNGPSAADGTTYSDPLPAGISSVTALCGSATGGAVCAAPSVGGGSPVIVSGAIPTLPPGGSVTITINGTAPTGPTQMLANTATVTPPTGTTDPNPSDNDDTATTSTPVQLQSFEID